jgi:asparagine synthase (glutamine-hydrolysing)
MCGIVAALGDVNIEPLLSLIAHRGPDGHGIVHDGDLHLGHVRLAIQDVSDAAAQPFVYGDVLLAYNGEMWNVEELRATFGDREWRTSSDTEVLAALLDRDGIEALDLIDGMFALVWRKGDDVFATRDRWGKIPLYLFDDGRTIIVASERKALPAGSRQRRFEPGVAVELQSRREIRWATPRRAGSLEPAAIRTMIRDGVAKRLIGDRPVCFLLSGGLDSTMILHYAVELHPRPVAYTAVYDDSSADLRAARRVADHYGVELIEVPVPVPTTADIEQAVRTIEMSAKAQVEIALAHIPLMRAIAADGFRVALSGEAADELFLGYGNLCIQSSKAQSSDEYRSVLRRAIGKMSRGNFLRVNKVMMSAGVEGRLPFMEEPLVAAVLASDRESNPTNKRALKRAADDVLPSWVVKRPKDTFQGGSGISGAAAELLANPIRYYNAEELRLFGGRNR